MARDRIRAIVLCEDSLHSSFASRLFGVLHVDPIRFVRAPSGEGSAEQWVRKQLVSEVVAHRRQANHQANLILVVITDGDRLSFADRKASLDAQLASEGHASRSDDERIVHLAPTWSIETWLAWLCDASPALDPFGESIRYKNDPRFRRLFDDGSTSTKRAADAWPTPKNDEANVVPALTDARIELRRVP